MERLIEVKEKYVYNIIAEFIGFLNKSSNTQFIQLGEILQYEQPTKYIVKDTEYNDNGTVPVLTANKSFILGYTLEEEDIFNKYPVIIFDDFTRDMKFVDFSFKIKSSAMKILHPKSTEINLYYVFLAMTQIEAPAGGHKRYWISEFQYKDIPYPDKEVQDDLTSRITLVNNEIKLLKQIVEKYKEQKRGLMQKLLTGEWRVKV